MSDPSNPSTDDNAEDGTGNNGADVNGVGDERHVCAVCGRILNAYVSPEGDRSWLHTFADLPEDHPAVPVGTDEGITAQSRCDFCSAESPAWELPARSFVLPGLTLGPVDNGSHGNWSACDRCAQLIDRNQWTALRRRALAAWSVSAPGTDIGPASEADGAEVDVGGVDRQLSQLYRLLRCNVTGPLRRSRP